MLRRDFIIGGACLAAAAGAVAIKPRRRVSLLKGGQLADMVPAAFGPWISQDVGDPLAINGPDSLQARLYNQLVTRVYSNQTTGAEIMMLLAYGPQQTDDLQLHRPEVCYPAFGYALVKNQEVRLPVTGSVQLPARRLLAQAEQRRESIVYWTRMGELLPASGAEQRADRVKIALRGEIPDGILSRFSAVVDDETHAWREIEDFIPTLLWAVKPQFRPVLIGTERANLMVKA